MSNRFASNLIESFGVVADPEDLGTDVVSSGALAPLRLEGRLDQRDDTRLDALVAHVIVNVGFAVAVTYDREGSSDSDRGTREREPKGARATGQP